jgi:hypothetical protein
MRSLLALAAALAAVTSIAAGVAGANGSPYSPGLVYGSDGVLGPAGNVRYVTLWTPKQTVVAVIRARDGRVLRSRALRGQYGVPLVAYDGTSGGLSGNGKWLLVASYGPLPGSSGRTQFVVLDTRSLKLRRHVVFDGSWSFDAISPDGSKVYFVQHISAGANPVYRVRSFDVATGLLRGALVDRLEKEEEMGGEPMARAASPDGRWAYTLYARQKQVPFVHALDTVERSAYCIGLPLELGYESQRQLRMKLRRGTLDVRLRGESFATIDTESWKVETTGS